MERGGIKCESPPRQYKLCRGRGRSGLIPPGASWGFLVGCLGAERGSSATQNFSSLAQNLTSLYVAPASLQDYCDSSGCLPGQIPLPSAGLSSKAILNKQATARMQQVLQLAAACKSGQAPTSACT